MIGVSGITWRGGIGLPGIRKNRPCPATCRTGGDSGREPELFGILTPAAKYNHHIWMDCYIGGIPESLAVDSPARGDIGGILLFFECDRISKFGVHKFSDCIQGMFRIIGDVGDVTQPAAFIKEISDEERMAFDINISGFRITG